MRSSGSFHVPGPRRPWGLLGYAVLAGLLATVAVQWMLGGLTGSWFSNELVITLGAGSIAAATCGLTTIAKIAGILLTLLVVWFFGFALSGAQALRACEKMGTGSGQPVQNPENIDHQPMPVPIFSQALSPGRWIGPSASTVSSASIYSEFVKKWGLAPAQLCKTLTISTIGRCLSPFFHKLSLHGSGFSSVAFLRSRPSLLPQNEAAGNRPSYSEQKKNRSFRRAGGRVQVSPCARRSTAASSLALPGINSDRPAFFGNRGQRGFRRRPLINPPVGPCRQAVLTNHCTPGDRPPGDSFFVCVSHGKRGTLPR